jgi:hypothetical protein
MSNNVGTVIFVTNFKNVCHNWHTMDYNNAQHNMKINCNNIEKKACR